MKDTPPDFNQTRGCSTLPQSKQGQIQSMVNEGLLNSGETFGRWIGKAAAWRVQINAVPCETIGRQRKVEGKNRSRQVEKQLRMGSHS
jgi:hypothetical protein